MQKGSVSLDEYGHIRPPKSAKGSLTFRVSETFDQISDFIKEKDPEIVVIEAYANKFPSGRSTARTIIVLSVFNEVVSMAALRHLGKDPVRYPVVTVRSSLSKLSGEKISSKEEAQLLENLYKLGYKRLKISKFNNNKKNLLKAFQQRFRQSLVNGLMDKECLLICKNLIK